MSGVVRPVETWSSAVVTPSVPIDAAWMPRHPPQLRGSVSTVEVLPLVPVTATVVSGKGAKYRAARPAKRSARLGVGDVGAHPRTCASGRATTATAPAGDRGRDEILAVDPRALQRRRTRARGDFAVIDREAGDDCVLRSTGQCAQLHRDRPCLRPAHARAAAADRTRRRRERRRA